MPQDLQTISVARSESGRTWRIVYDGQPRGDDRGYETKDAAILEAGRRVCADILDHKQRGLNRRYRLAAHLYTPARRLGAFEPYRQWREKRKCQ